MNWGAKVPIGVLLRAELARIRDESLRPSGLLSCVSDWFRTWPMFGSACASASGDETRPDMDIGRAVLVGPGEGVVELRAKGLGREFRAKGRWLMVSVWVVVVILGAVVLCY
jgi:hypothetical protein